jgi:hypothetical protein
VFHAVFAVAGLFFYRVCVIDFRVWVIDGDIFSRVRD